MRYSLEQVQVCARVIRALEAEQVRPIGGAALLVSAVDSQRSGLSEDDFALAARAVYRQAHGVGAELRAVLDGATWSLPEVNWTNGSKESGS